MGIRRRLQQELQQASATQVRLIPRACRLTTHLLCNIL